MYAYVYTQTYRGKCVSWPAEELNLCVLVYGSCDFSFAIPQVNRNLFPYYLPVAPIPFPGEFSGDGEGSAPLDIRSKPESSLVAGWLKLVTC